MARRGESIGVVVLANLNGTPLSAEVARRGLTPERLPVTADQMRSDLLESFRPAPQAARAACSAGSSSRNALVLIEGGVELPRGIGVSPDANGQIIDPDG